MNTIGTSLSSMASDAKKFIEEAFNNAASTTGKLIDENFNQTTLDKITSTARQLVEANLKVLQDNFYGYELKPPTSHKAGQKSEPLEFELADIKSLKIEEKRLVNKKESEEDFDDLVKKDPGSDFYVEEKKPPPEILELSDVVNDCELIIKQEKSPEEFKE